MTAFKRRFEAFLSRARARCEWDALKFDPTTQKLNEFPNILQKRQRKRLGLKPSILWTRQYTPSCGTMLERY